MNCGIGRNYNLVAILGNGGTAKVFVRNHRRVKCSISGNDCNGVTCLERKGVIDRVDWIYGLYTCCRIKVCNISIFILLVISVGGKVFFTGIPLNVLRSCGILGCNTLNKPAAFSLFKNPKCA